ncbi:MAG: hypothetical protein WBV82_21700 [Myxococcaceae bacterium]
MKQYLLSIYQPDGPPPASVKLEKIMRDVSDLNQEMQSAGAWVFSNGLHPPSTAFRPPHFIRRQRRAGRISELAHARSSCLLSWRTARKRLHADGKAQPSEDAGELTPAERNLESSLSSSLM